MLVDLESVRMHTTPQEFAGFMRELHEGAYERQVRMHFEQRQMVHLMAGSTWVDGIGAPETAIHANLFHSLGRQYGYDCWDDKGFCRRHLPDIKVKTAPRRLTIVNPWGEAVYSNRPLDRPKWLPAAAA